MMQTDLPTGGFQLLDVIAIHQECSIANVEEVENTRRPLTVNWDWAVQDGLQFDVFLGLSVGPSTDAPEAVSVGMVGEFEMEEGTPGEAFQVFVQVTAAAILFPYAREAISALTGRGPYGPFFLPNVNIAKMMKRYDFESTTGFKTLRNDPQVGRIYGFPEEVQLPLVSDAATRS